MSVLAIAKTREIAERMDAGEPFFPRCEGSSTPSDVMCRARRKDAWTPHSALRFAWALRSFCKVHRCASVPA